MEGLRKERWRRREGGKVERMKSEIKIGRERNRKEMMRIGEVM